MISDKSTQDTIEVTVGDTFQIALLTHHGTGFSWEVKGEIDSSYLELREKEYIPLGDEQLDFPGRDRFTFKALRKGDTSFILWYIRPWKKDNETNPEVQKKIYRVFIQ